MKDQHMVAVVGFDASATGEEIQKTIYSLLQTGLNLKIIGDLDEHFPVWSRWQIMITGDKEVEQ